MKFRKFFIPGMMIGVMTFSGCATTQSDQVSFNIQQEADNFNVIRRLSVLNTRTDRPLFEMVGKFSYQVNDSKHRLEIIVEIPDGKYKKNFVGLNEYTMYVIEDLAGSEVNSYTYEVRFLPETIIPTIYGIRYDE